MQIHTSNNGRATTLSLDTMQTSKGVVLNNCSQVDSVNTVRSCLILLGWPSITIIWINIKHLRVFLSCSLLAILNKTVHAEAWSYVTSNSNDKLIILCQVSPLQLTYTSITIRKTTCSEQFVSTTSSSSFTWFINAYILLEHLLSNFSIAFSKSQALNSSLDVRLSSSQRLNCSFGISQSCLTISDSLSQSSKALFSLSNAILHLCCSNCILQSFLWTSKWIVWLHKRNSTDDIACAAIIRNLNSIDMYVSKICQRNLCLSFCNSCSLLYQWTTVALLTVHEQTNCSTVLTFEDYLSTTCHICISQIIYTTCTYNSCTSINWFTNLEINCSRSNLWCISSITVPSVEHISSKCYLFITWWVNSLELSTYCYIVSWHSELTIGNKYCFIRFNTFYTVAYELIAFSRSVNQSNLITSLCCCRICYDRTAFNTFSNSNCIFRDSLKQNQMEVREWHPVVNNACHTLYTDSNSWVSIYLKLYRRDVPTSVE